MTKVSLQISKAFCEQHPEVRKAWIDDGIKEVAVQDAATRAWVVKPAWTAQPGDTRIQRGCIHCRTLQSGRSHCWCMERHYERLCLCAQAALH